MGKNMIEVLENLYNNWDNIKKEAKLLSQKKIYKDLDDICRRSIDTYYGSFTPNSYDRTESFYKTYRIIMDKDDFVIQLGAEIMPDTHRASTEYIYDLMFKEGWHGGGLNYEVGVSTPYWRTPARYFTKWGDRAPKTDAPFNIIEEELNDYIGSEYKKTLIDSLKRTFNKYI